MKDDPTVFLVTSSREAEREVRSLVESLERRVESFESPGELLAALDPERAGCVVLDVRAPWRASAGRNEPRPQQIRVPLPIVFVTGAPKAGRCNGAGRSSNLVEMSDASAALDGLLDAIEEAIEEDGRGRRERARGEVIADRLRSLTRREREVMAMVVNGLSNRRIADRFGISARTVEIHRARVMEKMDAGSLSELVRMACLRGVQIGDGPAAPGARVYRVANEERRQRKA